jgi:hypothetical protein
LPGGKHKFSSYFQADDHNKSAQLFHMNLILRPGKPEDARACGAICYAAFKAIADAHHFPPDFPDVETPVGLMNYAFSAPGIYSVVAEGNGQIVGSFTCAIASRYNIQIGHKPQK